VLLRLLSRVLGTGAESGREFLRRRGLEAAVSAVAQVGNTYTSSLYLCLLATLAGHYRQWGPAITGRSVLLVSYGSGNTMAVISARIAPDAPRVISGWDVEGLLASRRSATWDEYQSWMGSNGHGPDGSFSPDRLDSHPGSYYVRSLRGDGYREYGFRSPVPLRQPVPAAGFGG